MLSEYGVLVGKMRKFWRAAHSDVSVCTPLKCALKMGKVLAEEERCGSCPGSRAGCTHSAAPCLGLSDHSPNSEVNFLRLPTCDKLGSRSSTSQMNEAPSVKTAAG